MYSIIDIESNGGAYRKESIMEIAIYKYDGHKIVDQFISLVNPEAEITPFVQKLTKISPKMVKTAPKFHEIAKRVVEITEGTTLVGHNIEFDYRMLRQSFKRLGYEFRINTIDTIPLAEKLLPNEPSYSLGKLSASLGIPLTEHHRAAGDARATLELFKLLIIKDYDNEILQKLQEETNAKTYINKIKELTQDLPSEKGIVYFQNSKGTILLADYVEDINRAVKKLFNSKSKRWMSVQEECEQINFELVGNTITAQLLLLSKGLKLKSKNYIYGWFQKEDTIFVDKLSLQKKNKPIVKFTSYIQAVKTLEIYSLEGVVSAEYILQIISLQGRNEIWTSQGRNLGERLFISLKNGKLDGYGFYTLYHQIQSINRINKLKNQIDKLPKEVLNDLKIAILKKDFSIQQLPNS